MRAGGFYPKKVLPRLFKIKWQEKIEGKGERKVNIRGMSWEEDTYGRKEDFLRGFRGLGRKLKRRTPYLGKGVGTDFLVCEQRRFCGGAGVWGGKEAIGNPEESRLSSGIEKEWRVHQEKGSPWGVHLAGRLWGMVLLDVILEGHGC